MAANVRKFSNSISREREYRELLGQWKTRGITLTPCEREPLLEKWDSMFPVTEEMLASCPHYNDQFRWHRFSFKAIGALTDTDIKKSASDEFDKAPKSTLAMFFDYSDEAYIIKGSENLTAADIAEMHELMPLEKMDIYLMPAEECAAPWTYVMTHEHEAIGPYFCVACGAHVEKKDE